MNKDYLDDEKKTDQLLRTLGSQLSASRTQYANAVMNGETEAPPLLAEKPRKTIHGRGRIRGRRLLILVAVLILAMAMVVVTSEGVKEKMFNSFLNEKEGHTDVKPLSRKELPKFELKYVPKGYTVLGEELMPDFCRDITYGNKAEEYINFAVYKSESYNASIDNDTFKRKTTLIHDCEAYLFYDKDNTLIIWQTGDYTLEILTGLGEKETKKIAENIILK